MAQFTFSDGLNHRLMTKPGQSDTITVQNNTELSLYNFHGSDTVELGHDTDIDVFNLVSIYGHTLARNDGLGDIPTGHVTGSLYLIGGDMTGLEGSHESWDVGNSTITAGAQLTLSGGHFSGSVMVKGGASFTELGGSVGGAVATVNLAGGAFITDVNPVNEFSGSLNFLSEAAADSITLRGVTAISATISDSSHLMNIDVGAGTIWEGFVADFTNQPLQVDQVGGNIQIIADATPHVGMISLEHIA